MKLSSIPLKHKTDKTRIDPYRLLDMKVYGYALPGVPSHEGCVKVGETEREDISQRLREQTGTAGLNPELLFERRARLSDGRLFRDRQLHRYYLRRGIKRAKLNEQASEWFYFGDIAKAEKMTDDFIRQDYDVVQTEGEHIDYVLRQEQQAAVEATLAYFQNPVHGPEFLWNAKPRFGKTLTAYDLMRKMEAANVLIVTNRPAIANSWYDDFMRFIAWQESGWKFVSDTDALANTQCLTRHDYLRYLSTTEDENPRCLAFVSLQDLKGARFAGGDYDKLEWIPQNAWDLLIIDEAHEGIDTFRTDRAFDQITRRFTLHLSGTPFKALASQKFRGNQIYNWSYLDEQQAKAAWNSQDGGTSPYAALPALSLFTYQMSQLVEEQVAQGLSLESGENVDFAFNLNDFFSTNESGAFVYEEAVNRFLDNLHTGSLPFAQGEHQQQLNHTFWLLPRVAAAKRLEVLLNNHPFFKDYHVVLAAGDGISLPEDEDSLDFLETKAANERATGRSYDRVKAAIVQHQKTITLSVGQLTTGVTIPEWTAVMMLSNIKSPAFYFQAAFRAQNPHEELDARTGALLRKENAYVFDFAPDRTLELYDAFANNLQDKSAHGTTGERQDNIKELINFFPVIAQDDEGILRELDPSDILTIPGQIKAAEVVKRGFMSNLLFANISAIFSAPQAIRDILNKIAPERNKKLGSKRDIEVNEPQLNASGEVEIPREIVINTTRGLFGEGIYVNRVEDILEKVQPNLDRERKAALIARDVIREQAEGFARAREELGLTHRVLEAVKNKAVKALEARVEESLFQHEQQERKAEEEYLENLRILDSPKEKARLEETYQNQQEELKKTLVEAIQKDVAAVEEEAVASRLISADEQKKKDTEDEVRDHLRGFARTIPAFLMAYGNRDTTLATFEENIDQPTFRELTSITVEEFRQLRDGVPYVDEQGQQRQTPCLFDETVFNASIREFFDIKERLADYVHQQEDEDIFDYIPPQKTNQIFTPKRVVKMMVDLLQKQAPALFESKDSTFIDLYSKSGLYMSEIAKRLFVGLKRQIPDERERVRWILERQVYGVAPSNIIYHMIRNFVYAGYPGVSDRTLWEKDLTQAAETGTIGQALREKWGKNVKFDVIIGNPPYQEETLNTSDNPVYHLFMKESYRLAEKVCLITPARFLFNAGKTPKAWNREMLNDPHLSVPYYEPVSSNVFPGIVEIKGGIAVTFRDSKQTLGPIKAFIPNTELSAVLKKVKSSNPVSFSTLIYSPESHKFTELLHADFPNAEKLLSSGHKYDVTTNIFKKLPFVFLDIKPNDKNEYIQVYGRESNARFFKWIRRDYMEDHANLNLHKVFLPKSTSSGQLGEELSSPVVGLPGVAHTQTFLSIGAFNTAYEAESVLKYIKTKFARAMLGTLKVTQDNKKATWENVPLQNFTASSDIDWNQSVSDIDQQLYRKYGLTNEEVDFIESAIKPMI